MKKKVIIGSILVLFAIILGSTLAWWTWASSNEQQTNVVVTVEGATVSYEDGEDITNNNLIPTSTKEKGISKQITMSSTSLVYLNLDMTIVSLDAGLKDASFKYGLYNSEGTPVVEGNFASSNQNDVINLLKNVEVSSTQQTYTLYIWIDGNMPNPNTMYNQNFEFRLNASASDENSGNSVEYATETITSLLANNPNTMNNDDPDGNIRYMGADPNNYVKFNNELWRIIGVFDVASTYGGSTEKRLKIIRDESLGNMAWDSGNVNDWTTASLNTYLNETYLNTIDPTSQSLIGDAYWNLGGSSTFNDVTASMFYERERGTTVYSDHPTYWVGKIGLMYPSDYGYATSGGTTTNRASCLAKEMYNWNSSSYSDCYNNDYLLNSSSNQWTLSPRSGLSNVVFSVDSSGSVSSYFAYDSNNSASPVLYLKSDVTITGGSGTSTDPYKLGQ